MTVIDKYIEALDEPQRTELERVLRIIREITDDTEEVISYGMPVFKYHGHYLIGFAAFKDHMSIFPGAEAIEVLTSKLGGYKVSKGTIQFTNDKTIPEDLLREIIELRQRSILK